MVSLVIGLFSCILLAQVISTSTGLDSDSRSVFKNYYAQNDKLMKAFVGESVEGITPKVGNILITGNGQNVNISYHAEYYENEATGRQTVIAYRIDD